MKSETKAIYCTQNNIPPKSYDTEYRKETATTTLELATRRNRIIFGMKLLKCEKKGEKLTLWSVSCALKQYGKIILDKSRHTIELDMCQLTCMWFEELESNLESYSRIKHTEETFRRQPTTFFSFYFRFVFVQVLLCLIQHSNPFQHSKVSWPVWSGNITSPDFAKEQTHKIYLEFSEEMKLEMLNGTEHVPFECNVRMKMAQSRSFHQKLHNM